MNVHISVELPVKGKRDGNTLLIDKIGQISFKLKIYDGIKLNQLNSFPDGTSLIYNGREFKEVPE